MRRFNVFLLVLCLSGFIAAPSGAISLRQKWGDWCERYIIYDDHLEVLDFYQSAMNEYDYRDWLRRQYVDTGRVLAFRFDRMKRSYLRQLGQRIRQIDAENDDVVRYRIYEK